MVSDARDELDKMEKAMEKARLTELTKQRLFKQSATGATTGLTDGQPKREKVWVPTDAFLPCMHQVSQIVAPWIVAGQGKLAL